MISVQYETSARSIQWILIIYLYINTYINTPFTRSKSLGMTCESSIGLSGPIISLGIVDNRQCSLKSGSAPLYRTGTCGSECRIETDLETGTINWK